MTTNGNKQSTWYARQITGKIYNMRISVENTKTLTMKGKP